MEFAVGGREHVSRVGLFLFIVYGTIPDEYELCHTSRTILHSFVSAEI